MSRRRPTALAFGLGALATASAKDPAGFCLDDTSSGTQHRNPLPGP